jgi:hypothetical protein
MSNTPFLETARGTLVTGLFIVGCTALFLESPGMLPLLMVLLSTELTRFAVQSFHHLAIIKALYPICLFAAAQSTKGLAFFASIVPFFGDQSVVVWRATLLLLAGLAFFSTLLDALTWLYMSQRGLKKPHDFRLDSESMPNKIVQYVAAYLMIRAQSQVKGVNSSD